VGAEGGKPESQNLPIPAFRATDYQSAPI